MTLIRRDVYDKSIGIDEEVSCIFIGARLDAANIALSLVVYRLDRRHPAIGERRWVFWEWIQYTEHASIPTHKLLHRLGVLNRHQGSLGEGNPYFRASLLEHMLCKQRTLFTSCDGSNSIFEIRRRYKFGIRSKIGIKIRVYWSEGHQPIVTHDVTPTH